MSRDDHTAADRWTRRAELLRRAQAGDREAYRAFLEEIGPVLASFLRRWEADGPNLDDLCQEALLKMHRARHSYDPSQPLGPWLFAIARNVAVDHLRRGRRRLSREVPMETLPEVPADAPPLATADLEAALSSLPANQRQAFEFLKLEGLSVEEGARRAGTSPGALRVRASRAYSALKQTLRR